MYPFLNSKVCAMERKITNELLEKYKVYLYEQEKSRAMVNWNG